MLNRELNPEEAVEIAGALPLLGAVLLPPQRKEDVLLLRAMAAKITGFALDVQALFQLLGFATGSSETDGL